MGGDNGFLRLVAVPEVKTFADLKGRTVSVDALTTGYAFVLLELLERGGLQRERDYKVERAGGVMQRINVDLPDPERPMITMKSPGWTSKVTSSRAWVPSG